MTCRSCTAAERDPMHAEMRAGCMGCEARALALVLGTTAPGEPEAHRRTLEALFGAEWETGRALVQDWSAAIKAAKTSGAWLK